MDDIFNFNICDDYNNILNEQMIQNFDFLEEFRNVKRKYTVLLRINPFHRFDDDEFKRRYRFSKEQVNRLYELIDGENTLEPMVRILFVAYLFFAIFQNEIERTSIDL